MDQSGTALYRHGKDVSGVVEVKTKGGEAMTREEAIKVLGKIKDGFIAVHNGNPVVYGYSDYAMQAFDMAIEALKVDLVRCGECKYQDKGENEREAWNLCAYRPWLYKPTSDECFCSYGERRSDG